MENNKNILVTISTIIIGLFIGWLIWGNQTRLITQNYSTNTASHMMPDGTMMGGNTSMDSMMENMNEVLQGKTGDAFDQEFISQMIIHHQGAIDMAKLAMVSAKHQEIKDLANAIITAQTTEIEQMKLWQRIWYKR